MTDIAGVILIVEIALGLELTGRVVDGEGRRIGTAQRVGQRVLVVVRGGVGAADVRIRSGVLGGMAWVMGASSAKTGFSFTSVTLMVTAIVASTKVSASVIVVLAVS